ncbi:MAG: hypothetical protein AAGD96_19215, partial [Chloroflexota bacterium]
MRKTTLLVGAVYLFLIAILGASAPSLNSHLIGNNIDSWIFFWNDWWFRTSVAEGSNLFFTPYLFAPAGTDLTLHSSSFVTSALAYLFESFTGPVAAYNLALLSGLWIGALGMFLLAQEHTENVASGFVAGILFTFAPYHLTQVFAHAHLGSIHWWPWFLLSIFWLFKTSKWQYALFASLFGALTFWTGLQLAILLAFLTLFYLLITFERSAWTARNVILLTTAGFVTVVLCSPYLIQLFVSRGELAAATTFFDDGSLKQTDVLAYIIPPTYHPLWGIGFVPFYENFVANRAYVPYLGLTSIVLAIVAAVRFRQARYWLIGTIVWISLALGTQFRFNGTVTDFPLPFDLINDVFPFSALRSPDRFNLLVVFSLSMIVGYAIKAIPNTNNRLGIIGLISGLLVLEFLVFPLPTHELPGYSEFYETLAEVESDEAVFDYPAGYSNAKIWLYYQTIHEKPTVDGHLSRYDQSTYQFIAESPLAQALYANESSPGNMMIPVAETVTPPVDDFLNNNIRYVIHHLEYSDEIQKEHLYKTLPYVPIYKDEVIEVFDLANLNPYEFTASLTHHPSNLSFGPSIQLDYVSW